MMLEKHPEVLDQDLREHFPTTVARDFFHLVAGDYIGRGAARYVYACQIDRSLVLKIEDTPCSFQNVHEWDVWREVEHTRYARWFAPCVEISSCGTVLLQKRTKPADASQYPSKLPSFFTDTKRSNFGMLDGRFVCHDYGVTLLRSNGLVGRQRKAEWWDEESPS